MSVTGSCACGAVRFEATGKLRDVVFCHCSRCRRWHGHIGAYTRTPKDELKFHSERGLKWHQLTPDTRRGFCSECGSTMFFDDTDQPRSLAITAGVLDPPTGLKPLAHIFVGSKGDYYARPTDCVAYDELPPPRK